MYMFGTSKETYLCEACGKVSRGRHKLQRLHQYHTGFACALGTGLFKTTYIVFDDVSYPCIAKDVVNAGDPPQAVSVPFVSP